MRHSIVPIGAIVLLLAPPLASRAAAHGDLPLTPETWWLAWSGDVIVLGLIVGATVYARGVRCLWAQAGRGRGVQIREVAAWGTGLLVLTVALVSPLHRLGESLFSAHMAQHLLLTTVAAPLLALGAPQLATLWALPLDARRRIGGWWRDLAVCPLGRLLGSPVGVWGFHVGALWIWHLPGLYQGAIESEFLHASEHGSLLGTAFLYWSTMFSRNPRGAGRIVGVLSVFGMAVQGSALGALITFAPTPWYPVYASRVVVWGLTPLADQQLAGLLMWVPTGLAYVVIASVLLITWLTSLDASARSPSPKVS